MGGAPKTVYVPQETPESITAASRDAAYVAPTAQQSPTAQRGETAKGGSAMASGLGFGGTVLTSGQGLVQQNTSGGKGKALLGV